jgi:hypothetical protein
VRNVLQLYTGVGGKLISRQHRLHEDISTWVIEQGIELVVLKRTNWPKTNFQCLGAADQSGKALFHQKQLFMGSIRLSV